MPIDSRRFLSTPRMKQNGLQSFGIILQMMQFFPAEIPARGLFEWKIQSSGGDLHSRYMLGDTGADNCPWVSKDAPDTKCPKIISMNLSQARIKF